MVARRSFCGKPRRILLTVLLGGLLGATLVRLGPGFGVDERELDSRLNAQSQQAIRAERARDNNIAVFYVRYLAGLVRGDFGFSRSLNRPVSELLKERLPLTLVSLGYGVAGGVAIGLGARAAHGLVARSRRRTSCPPVLSGLCLAVPAAVIALVFLWIGAGWPLGHRAGGFPARLSLRQEPTGLSLSIAARGGGAGQRIERFASPVGARCCRRRRNWPRWRASR